MIQKIVWKNVNNVFAGLNETNRRVSGHSISPYNSDTEAIAHDVPKISENVLVNFNNNNDFKKSKNRNNSNDTKETTRVSGRSGRTRSRVHDRPIYVDLSYVPETTHDRLGDFSNLVRAKTYVLSSEMANRDVFSKILFGIRKWANPEIETTSK